MLFVSLSMQVYRKVLKGFNVRFSTMRTTKKKISRFLKALFILFSAAVLCTVVGRNHQILGSGLIIFRWFFIGFGLFLTYLFYRRVAARGYTLSIALLTVMVLMEYGWTRLHEASPEKAATAETPVTLMTYNLLFINENANPCIKSIREQQPDILVLQEFTHYWRHTLDAAIGDLYPYKMLHPSKSYDGLGIYSRYKILGDTTLHNGTMPFDNRAHYAQLADLLIHDKHVQVINVHLSSPAVALEHSHGIQQFSQLLEWNYQLRIQQLDAIETLLHDTDTSFHATLTSKRSARQQPTTLHPADAYIMLGDYNTPRYEPLFRTLKYDWVNLFDIAGEGYSYSFPNTRRLDPFLSLDHIMLKGAVQGIEAKVIKGGSSDHCAVVGKVKL